MKYYNNDNNKTDLLLCVGLAMAYKLTIENRDKL
jgi:hypothetical protein